MTRRARICLAFVAAPFAGVSTLVLITSLESQSLPIPGAVVAPLVIAYVLAIVIGVPAWLMSRPWHLQSTTFYVAAAVCVASPAIVVATFAVDARFALATALSACVSGVTFRSLVGREPNKAMERAGYG